MWSAQFGWGSWVTPVAGEVDFKYSLRLARRSSGSAQVLLGVIRWLGLGTGPVGVEKTQRRRCEVVDISRDEEDDTEGGETSPSIPKRAPSLLARLGSGHASSLSTLTLGPLDTTIDTHAPSSFGIGITNLCASTMTVYPGSLGHLTRPSFAASADSHLAPPTPPKLLLSSLSTEINLNLPSSSYPRSPTHPQFYSQPYWSLVYLSSPSASSTTFTHLTHSKRRSSGSTFNGETHGYGYK
ncbi:hypothetical protein BDP27DRAFT_1327652 [Rhodocollybia butyracea]|uniref:Uncharacterized protein n=1 Tax=Rhodocollybia butyracea TaxID=206335 RepID=A0A9P5PRP6_9AGAR|nr:hypothetical protein BDP27DRAFT_1327652 [Rhodocollybia butyracea]